MDKILDYKTNWTHHVDRMLRSILPKIMKNISEERRDGDKPLKRPIEEFGDRNGPPLAYIFLCSMMIKKYIS